jgi:hypothetical protein
LSQYNPTKNCWEHRRAPRRLSEELEGKHVQKDDEWLLRIDWEHEVEVETWRPHMCSETFIAGMRRREFSDEDKDAYESGAWLGEA